MHCTYDTLPIHRCERSRRAEKRRGEEERFVEFRVDDLEKEKKREENTTHRPPRLTTRADLRLLVHQLLDLGELLLLLPFEQKVEHFGFLEERERFGLGSLLVEGGVDLESSLRVKRRTKESKLVDRDVEEKDRKERERDEPVRGSCRDAEERR